MYFEENVHVFKICSHISKDMFMFDKKRNLDLKKRVHKV
jgi:hypothetical protein